jgi:phosphoglycolate phosphatase
VASFLVLWDVDFTLVKAPGVGRRLYQLAFAELFGRQLPERASQADMAGRTDRAIALDVLALADVPDPRDQVVAFETALARLAPSMTGLVRSTAVALPGAAAALSALAARRNGPVPGSDPGASRLPGSQPDTRQLTGWQDDGRPVQSLLTGNVRPMAEVKLAPLGLTEQLDLDVGAYGNEHEVRAELVHLARLRASLAYGRDFGGEATVIIGDTPHDVEAALVAGARAIAVATGFFPIDELAAAGAHTVLPDLSDTDAVIAAILDHAPR